MAEPIGALRVDLSASAAQFEADMGKARAAVNSFGAGVKATMAGFGASVTNATRSIVNMRTAIVAAAGVGGLALLIKGAIAAADDIAKMSDRVGIGIEALQELSYAASLAGIDNEKFGKILERLNTAIGEAATGTLTYKQAFEAANIAVRDGSGNIIKAEDALMRLADAITNTSDQAARANVLYGIFGQRLGTSLLPLFKDGAEGIRQMRQEARDLGVVLDAVMVREAEKSGDQLERLGKILSTNVTRTLLSLTPQIIALSDAMISKLRPAVQWLVRNLPDAVSPSDELRRRIGDLQAEIEELAGQSFNELLESGKNLGYNLYNMFPPETAERIGVLLKQLRELDSALKTRVRKEEIVKVGVENDAIKVIDELQRKRELAVTKQIQKLEDQAKLEALIGTEKTYQNELTNIANMLLDEQGNKTRDITDAEKERIRSAIELAQVNKQESALKRHILDLERETQQATIDLGIAAEIHRAIIQAQNLLIDEQGNKTRDLTDAEKERIATTTQTNYQINRETQLRKHILDLQKQNEDTVIGLGVAEEKKRAIIQAQNLLIDEQGAKLRDLTDAEKEAIEAAVSKSAHLRQMQDTISELESFGTRAFDRIGESITKMFAEGKASAIDFQNIVNSILSEIVQEFLKLAVINPIKNAIFGTVAPSLTSLFSPFGTGGSGAAPGSFRAAQETGLPGFAGGGSFKVGGVAGTDKNLVQFRATRGETVQIRTPGQQGEFDHMRSVAPVVMGERVEVNVYAPPGSSVETKESKGVGGRTIDVIIDEITAKNVGTPGSRTARAIKTTFAGLGPVLNGR